MNFFRKNPDEEQGERRQRSNNSNVIMAVVCIYIIYLGIDILRKYAEGKGAGAPAWVQILSGIFFIAIGGIFIAFYIRTYLRGRAAENEQAKEDEQVMEESEERENEAKADEASGSEAETPEDADATKEE